MVAREPKRGDVYYMRFDDSWGSEQAVGRPSAIISVDSENERSPVVAGLIMTTTPRTHSTTVQVRTGNKTSYVLCNQIRTYDKSRCGDYLCTLTDAEMAKIESALAYFFGLRILDDITVAKYKHETEVAVAQVSAQIAAKDNELAEKDKEIAALKDEILAKSVEQDLHKRLYEKSLEMLCEKKLTADLPKPEAPERAELPKVAAEEEKPKLVDLNSCAAIDLVNIGVDTRVANMILASRPFGSVEDLRYVTGVTRIGFKLLEKKVTVGDWVAPKPEKKSEKKAESGKVNINTATWQELRDFGGISEKTAQSVAAYRNKHGKFTSLEDLLNVDRFGKKCLEKSRDKLTV